MEAFVTLKISVSELDLVRDALKAMREQCKEKATDGGIPPKDRQQYREVQARTGLMLEKLR
jgi:hypothetical protein